MSLQFLEKHSIKVEQWHFPKGTPKVLGTPKSNWGGERERERDINVNNIAFF